MEAVVFAAADRNNAFELGERHGDDRAGLNLRCRIAEQDLGLRESGTSAFRLVVVQYLREMLKIGVVRCDKQIGNRRLLMFGNDTHSHEIGHEIVDEHMLEIRDGFVERRGIE